MSPGAGQRANPDRAGKLAACAMLMALAPVLVSALEYPTRTVTIIVPASPGGGADVQARLLAKGLAQRLGKHVVVDNRPGAGGRIGARLAAQATPDGHTLFLASTSTFVIEPILHTNVGFDPLRDFAPITVVAEMPLVLVASPSLAVRSVADLLAAARKQPGRLTYASWGPGTLAHLDGELFKTATQADIVHVPYKGAGPALIDIIAGQVSIMFASPLAAMPSIRAGKLAALAVTGSKRLPVLAKVPTLAEAGVPGFELELWFAVVAPAKTPRKVSARLNEEIVAVLKSPEFTASVEDQGGFVVASSPGELSRRIQADSAAVTKLVKAINLKVEE
jgi:tripartite-type tricarboxylate transporter receptor subunit TctC